MTDNTHGGARPGAGRPPLADEPTERHTVTAPASVWRLLEALGDGNRSEGLRLIVEEALRKDSASEDGI